MNIVTFVLIGVLVLLSLSCFRGLGKQGRGAACCKQGPNKNFSKTPQLIELQKINVQIEQMEKVNQKLSKEIASLKNGKGSTT